MTYTICKKPRNPHRGIIFQNKDEAIETIVRSIENELSDCHKAESGKMCLVIILDAKKNKMSIEHLTRDELAQVVAEGKPVMYTSDNRGTICRIRMKKQR